MTKVVLTEIIKGKWEIGKSKNPQIVWNAHDQKWSHPPGAVPSIHTLRGAKEICESKEWKIAEIKPFNNKGEKHGKYNKR